MRNMTDDEMKKILKVMQDAMDDQIRNDFLKSFSTLSANTSTSSSAQSKQVSMRSAFGYSISPTDVDAKGQYEYQEPEQDEQGTFYGYKILYRDGQRGLISPRYPAVWHDGQLTSNHVPNERSMYGIHFTKRPDHPELDNYMRPFGGSAYFYDRAILVKCALSGTIVETEQGFRAEHADIIGVYEDGYWQSYQDYSQRSRPNPYTNPWENDEEEIQWKAYYRKTWNPNPLGKAYFDPSADS